MKISMVIPVFNEETTIVELLERTLAVPLDKEILVVDDGSTDRTAHLLRLHYSKRDGVRLIFHASNLGKGTAIRTALKHATGEVVAIQDADFEYDPVDFTKIAARFGDPSVNVVYGTRFSRMTPRVYAQRWLENRFRRTRHELKSPLLYFGVMFLTFAANALYGAGITDEATCYKAFRRTALEKIRLRSRRFEFCPEITAKMRKAGHRIEEVAISYHPRGGHEGKKLKLRDGPMALWTLVKYRFVD